MNEYAQAANTVQRRAVLPWAVLLYFGLWLISELTTWLFFRFFGKVLAIDLATHGVALLLVALVSPLLLLGTLPLVRRHRHYILSQLWLYTIVIGILSTLSGEVLRFIELEGAVAAFSVTWITNLVQMALLIWFARRVSALSFGHSALFIGLVIAMNVPASILPPHFSLMRAEDSFTGMHTALLAGKVLIGVLAATVLVHPQALVATTGRLRDVVAVLVLVPMALTLLGLLGRGLMGIMFFDVVVTAFAVSELLPHAVVFGVAYLVRIRDTVVHRDTLVPGPPVIP